MENKLNNKQLNCRYYLQMEKMGEGGDGENLIKLFLPQPHTPIIHTMNVCISKIYSFLINMLHHSFIHREKQIPLKIIKLIRFLFCVPIIMPYHSPFALFQCFTNIHIYRLYMIKFNNIYTHTQTHARSI